VAIAGKIRLGTIVWADVNDQNGCPIGEHPVVILSPQKEIDAGQVLVGAVCTTSFSYPLPPGCFEMPSKPGPGGHEITGLEEACVVKGALIQPIPDSRIRRIGKRALMSTVRQLQQWMRVEQQRLRGDS
jgi:hypothetical protein